MSVLTVKVSNVSLNASEKEIREFFSFSGKIQYVDIQSDTESSKVAFVTFKDAQGADTAVLLTGATIVDQAVRITLAPDYKLPSTAPTTSNIPGSPGSAAFHNAEDVVSSMLAKGFILGKDALNRAKSFDDKHQFTSTASARVASLDQRIGLSEKFSMGATIMNDKAKEMDEKYQVSDKTKTAFAAAEQTVSSASSKIMQNRYVLTGATWVTGALSRVREAAAEVQQKTMEKLAEEEQTQPQSQPGAEKNGQQVVDKDCTQQLEAHHDRRDSSSGSPPKAADSSSKSPPKAADSSNSPPKAAAAAAEVPAPKADQASKP